MTKTPPNQSDRDHLLPESEILLGRMVDGETTADDRAQFELLAGGDPSLWRRLAIRQHDMALLAAKIERDTRFVEQIELPAEAIDVKRSYRMGWLRPMAYSGWAATLLLAAALWIVTVNQASERNSAKQVFIDSSPALSYDDHLREYLMAPYVIGEMAPTMLHREVMSDGRTAIRFLRRIEEVLFLPEGQEPPTDPDGAFTTDPSRLRGDEAYREPSN